MKRVLILPILFFVANLWSQQLPVNCNLAVSGCSTPQFPIVGQQPAYNTPDFGTGTVSNPSNNPQGVNSGCLLSGETVSTFITINVVSNGTLEWSMIGLNANGTPSNSGCFDWIMWADSPSSSTDGCAGINGNSLPPVSCNWNGSCNGNTGMSTPANYPPNASNTSYQPPLNVLAGQTYILCLSNYSFTNQNVNLNFFGTAQVVCGVSAADQTICQGNSTNVTIATPGYSNPSFNWLVTNGVANPAAGTTVVNPTVTTTYQVVVTDVGSTPLVQDTATFTITVVPTLTPNAGPDQTVCFGTNNAVFQLSGNAAVAPVTGAWQAIVPSGMTPPATATYAPNPSNPNATVTVNQPGTYKFVWKHTSALCGVVRDTMIVNVVALTATAATVNPSCGGYSDGTITITSPGAIEYSFNNGATWVTSNTQGGFAAGPYNVCARNAMGCQKCITVTLIDPTPIVVSVSNDTTICQNGTASMVASATGGTTYQFHWDHTASLLANQDVSPLATGYYPVYAESESGCLSQPDSILVTVRAPISGSLTPLDQNVCPGYPGTISTAGILGGIGAPYGFTWSNGYSNSGTSSSITESPQSTTMYTVTVTDGCESTPLVISTQIVTYPVPVPLISVDEPVKCEPAVFTLSNTTDPNMTASTVWNISSGQQYIDQDLIISDSLMAGAYDVQLIVVSPNGCIDSNTFVGFLSVLPKPVADFKWSPDPVTMFNTNVTLSNYSTGADTYDWTMPGGLPSHSTQEDAYTFYPDGEVGNYYVTLISTSYLGCSDTITRTITVHPEVLLYAPNTFTPDGDEFNQSWGIFIEGIDPSDFNLIILNRWGEIIWESNDVDGTWDGTYHGQIVPQGTYIWAIRTKDMLTDKKYEFNGSINITY